MGELQTRIRTALRDAQREHKKPDSWRMHPVQLLSIECEGICSVIDYSMRSDYPPKTLGGILVVEDVNMPLDEIWLQDGISLVTAIKNLKIPEGCDAIQE